MYRQTAQVIEQETMMKSMPFFCFTGLRILLVVMLAGVSTVSSEAQENATPRRITSGSQGEFEPQWSPDGSMLSYGSGEMGNQNVAIINVETGEETFLTKGLGFVHATTWSPDGHHVAYATGSATESGFVSHIYIVSLESKEVRQLTQMESIDGSPSWSPDGESIAFPSERSGAFNIWIQPIDGSEAIMVTVHPELDHGPEWSPDGKVIAFHSERGGNSSIWVVGPENPNRPLTISI